MNKKTKEFNEEFKKIKRSIFSRDNFRCQIKENTHDGALDIDHIIPRSIRGTSNKKNNLITLCRFHHTSFHLLGTREKIKELRKILTKKHGHEYDDTYCG